VHIQLLLCLSYSYVPPFRPHRRTYSTGNVTVMMDLSPPLSTSATAASTEEGGDITHFRSQSESVLPHLVEEEEGSAHRSPEKDVHE